MLLHLPEGLLREHLLGLGPVLPPPAPRRERPVVASPRRPDRFVRELPASPVAAAKREAPSPRMEPLPSVPIARGWDSPLAIGALLMFAPPLGLAALWSSSRYTSDARLALTVMTALTMCLAASVAIAVLVVRG